METLEEITNIGLENERNVFNSVKESKSLEIQDYHVQQYYLNKLHKRITIDYQRLSMGLFFKRSSSIHIVNNIKQYLSFSKELSEFPDENLKYTIEIIEDNLSAISRLKKKVIEKEYSSRTINHI
ncbi:hypothetical protein KY334_04045 [Candidatus Woesearchaeota archaeon]|nr:hypothetical protein [Candidatus Woesearchaeota archaeon]